MENLSIEEKLELLTNLAKEKKALKLIDLDVSDVNDMTDTLLVCSGEGTIHTKTIGKYIIEQSKKFGVQLHHKEGLQNGKWILLDFSDVVIHIFDQKTREYYKLEHLWREIIEKKNKNIEEGKK